MRIDVPSIIGITPFEHPDSTLVLALSNAGALGVLDLGHQPDPALLAKLARRHRGRLGARFPEHTPLDAFPLPRGVDVVIVPASSLSGVPLRSLFPTCSVLVQVRDSAETELALSAGADGLIAKGCESSGQVAEESTFILLQRLLATVEVPVWAQGGIGLHSAAACMAAGAQGVVLDSQLSLLEEASTSLPLRRAVAAMDGSETAVLHGYRLYHRPGAQHPPASSPEALAAQLGNVDPTREPITLGQDAALAAPFAQRYGTARRLVTALEGAFSGHLRQARALAPLAPHAPLAASLGTTYPIVQGPMTRVSDVAPFTQAVAEAGALPFVALALMHGDEARALLRETKERLAGKPWGVGILGFVPPELREQQLAVIDELKPNAVLIAGGRPSQARPLEQAGIATFLHVPSPGLLDAFLKSGAKRFVFEGRECGGHVGPRTSFLLWESAIERLLEVDDLRDVSVLFAGGIHDARSASMVSVMAAPLAARGAKVGVLMGSAYLFTDECVASGAITPAFQREAERCTRTALVETAPGHATRCARTAFVETFERERERLQATGADAQTIWAELEQLNLGRLRMAAKGLRREGERLLTMDEAEQHKEGMFMIGQVATLRDRRCTLAELHRDVSESSRLRLEQVELSAPAGDPIDIAIVGAACVFPDAPDLEAYWSNIIRGENAVREVPRERWDSAIHFGQGSEQTPSKWGGFLDPVPFDPALFGIPPRSLASIDPTQLLALHVANAALDDAGLLAQGFDRERTGVVFGAEGGSDIAGAYALRGSYSRYFEGELPPELADHLPKFTEDSFAGVLGNVVSGRIASRLDLRGPNYTTDAACASSLAALSAACRELTVGAADVMIAGGADLHNGLNDYLMFASAHALSPSGQCRAFDAKADGIALGEGVAAVVLKRLEDAERDGDRIYAVIKGIGASSDGKALGLTAPRKEGQIRAVERAYQQAGISAAEVGLVEAHGTGTVVGDRTELAALSDHFIASGALAGSCTLGSVKSQIGHTKCAAGMAGLIKAMLAVQRGVLLATKNLTSPNPGYSADSPFALRQSASPWTADVRHAGVSAFGFGGTNFHVVLSGHGELANRSYRDWPQELFVLRAHTAEELASLIARLEMSSLQSGVRLCELAASVAKADAPVRCTFVVGSLAELRSKLAIAREGMSRDGVFFTEASAGKLAMLIPGQGSQSPGMLADLFVAFPALRETLDPAYQASLFPAGAFTHEERERQQRAITDTRVAQPTLGMVSLGVVRLLRELGVEPALLAGHSYGELVALAVADAFDADTLRVLSAERGRCIAEAAGRGAGTMAAVRASIEHVREALTSHPDVMVANHNAPDQVVIAGSEQSIAEAVATLERAGLNARKIPVSCAFHSPLVSAARQTFAEVLARTELRAPSIPVYANATARAYPADANAVRDGLSTQLVEPVRFVEQIEAMYEAGARVFVEAGPGAVLTDLVGRILRGRPHVAVACGSNATQGLPSLLQALARLIAAGVQVNLAPLFADRVEPIELGVVRAPAATAWLVDGLGARPLHGELPDIAMRPLRKRVALTTALAAPTSDREGTVREFLRTTRELVDAQRQVLLRYLGSEVVPTAERLRSDVRPSDQLTLPKENVIEVLGEPVPVVPAISALDALVIAVGNRTGYPAEMLDPDLDLEADLGIDSIKRLEIVAELRDRMQLAGSAPSQAEQDAMIEKLASGKTMRALAQMLEELQRGPASVAEAAPPAALEPTVVSASELERYVVDVIEVPQAHSEPERVRGKRFVIAGDAAPIAQAIATLLRAHGAEAELVAADQPLGAVDGMIFLLTQDASHESIIQAFLRLQEAVAGNAAWLVAATALGGRFGHHAYGPRPRPVAAGVCGLLKSVAKEHPERHVRVVDLALEEDPRVLASHLFTELVATDAQVEVGWAQGVRYAPSIAKQAVAVPTDRIKLDKASVVLITGGARGITGQVAIEMARRYGCKLELVGRTALIDDNEPSELAEAQDPSALRKLLIARMNGAGPTSPAAIEAQVRQILAEREIRATLTAIERAGGHASYHSADVGDERSLNALIDRLQATHGRIDGVIHAAGRIEDKLLVNKTRESFARVFSTKVAGARTLIERLSKDARFFVFFSSVSSTFGNRGQTDYAAANDALDKLAHWLHGTIDGRVLSINWGPWRGIGMVGPELEREYNKRGIGLISPAQGIEHFFDELLSGDGPQAILTASHSGAFALGGAE